MSAPSVASSSDQLSAENMALVNAIGYRMHTEIMTEVQASTNEITRAIQELRTLLDTARSTRTKPHNGGGAPRAAAGKSKKPKTIPEIITTLFERDPQRFREIFKDVLMSNKCLDPPTDKMSENEAKTFGARQCKIVRTWCDTNSSLPAYTEDIKIKLLKYSEEITQAEEAEDKGKTPDEPAAAVAPAEEATEELEDQHEDAETSQPPRVVTVASGDVSDVIAAAASTRVTGGKKGGKEAAPRKMTPKKTTPAARNPSVARP